MDFLSENLAIPKTHSNPPSARRLLAHIHSGELLRRSLPKFLRASAVSLLLLSAVSWVISWPAIYEEFERWNLVRVFFAQFITLTNLCLLSMITILRAKHLELLPADDFVVLRATAVLCRWFGEVALVFVLGMALSAFFVGPVLASMVEEGSKSALGLSIIVWALAALFIAPVFLLFYALATAIDLSLAIEFNTRAERTGRI